MSQTYVPKNAQSCNELDLEEIEQCISDVIHKEKEKMNAECSGARTVNIVVTILAESDPEAETILNQLNDPNLINQINDQLPGETNDLGSANPATVVQTGNLILWTF